MLFFIEKKLAERRAEREEKMKVGESRLMRSEARGTAKVTTQPRSRSRDDKRWNINDLEDDQFDFQSCYPEEQARTRTSSVTCAAAAAAADDDDDDDWRKMKMESIGMNDLSRVQRSQTIASVKQCSTNVSNQQGVHATHVTTTPG